MGGSGRLERIRSDLRPHGAPLDFREGFDVGSGSSETGAGAGGPDTAEWGVWLISNGLLVDVDLP